MSLFPLLVLASSLAGPPLQLHPENPRYFLFRGKPTFLITSGEHYGAVLNLDFDDGPTSTSCGARLQPDADLLGHLPRGPRLVQDPGQHARPAPGRFSCPWARQGEKFDLDRFDEAYFRRLRDFVAEAGRRGIVVEYVLFCPLYEEALWDVSPMNARNNVNGVGGVPAERGLTLKHAELLDASARLRPQGRRPS